MASGNSQRKKMRILQVGWGWPPNQNGGAIIYTKNLCRALIDRGLEVTYFYSGNRDLWQSPYLKENTEENLRLVQLVNSPNVYNYMFNNAESEIANKVIEQQFLEVLSRVKPDIVHIQNFPGFCASIVSLCNEQKVPIVVSLHNYIPLCPKGEVFNYSTGKICNPKTCGFCMTRKTGLSRETHRLKLSLPGELPRQIHSKVRQFFPASKTNVMVGDNGTENYDHTRRIAEFSLHLDRADLLIGVSSKVRDLYLENMSLAPKKCIVQHIGTNAAQNSRLKHREKPKEKVHFIFLGSLAVHKGINIVLEALRQLKTKNYLLSIYAPLDDHFSAIRNQLEAELNVKFCGSYRHEQLNAIMDSADVGIVPPIWHDNAPQVVFEMLASGVPIVCSNVGGMKDFVKDKQNGWIYSYDDPQELAAVISSIIDNPQTIVESSKNITPMKTISQHAKEMEATYTALITQKGVDNK